MVKTFGQDDNSNFNKIGSFFYYLTNASYYNYG